MSAITLSNIYQLFKDAVRHSTGAECQRLNTFAVLQSMQNLSSENFGKFICDKNKPFFYSRLWESLSYNPSEIKIDWPALAVFENNFNYKDPFSKKSEKCYNFFIRTLDQYKENDVHTSCEGCRGRVINDIYRDTEVLMDEFLAYINDVTHVTLAGNEMLLNTTYYNWLIAQVPNTLVGSTINEMEGRAWSSMLRKENPDITGVRVEGLTASDLYGTFFNLRVCLNYCVEHEVEISEFKPVEVADLGCC